MEKQLVVFSLGSEDFGVEITAVDSIIKLQEITKVPRCPDFVEGITNLRGIVLPVIDLRKRLKVAAEEATNETRIVVVNLDAKPVGMVVDAVSEVLSIQDEEIESTPAMISSVDTSFITGIVKIEQRLIILLDLVKVLSAEEKQALQEL